MPRTKQEWFRFTSESLASLQAFVPLDEPTLEVAMRDALDVWGQYVPNRISRSIKLVDGMQTVDLTDFLPDQDDQSFSIGDYQYADSLIDVQNTLLPFHHVQLLALTVQGPRLQFEINTTIERWSQFLGGKEDAVFDHETKKLFVWNPRGMDFLTFEIFLVPLLTDIETHRYAIFGKLLRAQARRQMIQIMSRFGEDFPGPVNPVATDVSQQQSVADTEMEEVLDVLERLPEAMAYPRWD